MLLFVEPEGGKIRRPQDGKSEGVHRSERRDRGTETISRYPAQHHERARA